MKSPLFIAAQKFAAGAGYGFFEIKLQESRVAPRHNPAYDVFVRQQGAPRGKKIGSILLKSVYEAA